MTRDAEHTLSPQSVVDGDRVLDAAAAYLKQQYGASHGLDHPTDRERILSSIPPAPAPSSLAGGEVTKPADTSWSDWPRTSHDRRYEIGMRPEADGGAECPFCLNAMDQTAEVVIVNHNGSLALCHASCLPDECLAALSPEAPAREAKAFAMKDGMTTHPTLRSANIARQDEWDQDGQITASYRGNELAGEVGEACNVIKKLERERLGILGSRATVGELADELADVLICADLIAMHYGIDLEAAVVRKFNATSEKVGLQTRLAAPNDGGGS